MRHVYQNEKHKWSWGGVKGVWKGEVKRAFKGTKY